jgi:hypothetical protein
VENDPRAQDEPEDQGRDDQVDERPETDARGDSAVTPSLDAFASIQRITAASSPRGENTKITDTVLDSLAYAA